MLPSKTCLACSKTFQPARSKQKLCSVACKKTYQHGANASQYKTGVNISPEGYVRVQANEYEHRRVAEKALGKPLPKRAVVHHVDENKLNNSPDNLVICPSQNYHAMLHSHKKIIEAGGEVGKHLFCGSCKELLPLDCFNRHKGRIERFEKSGWCRMCSQIKDRERQKIRRNQ